MADSTDSFGYWVRRRRKALDLSQAALAQKLPCSLAMIKKIEGDVRRPSAALAERLAICLGLTAREQKDFLAAARGLRLVDALPLDQTPAPHPAPLDRLPTPSAPLIGRQAELTALTVLLASPDVRLLTIVGPGGMGKTRLALATAQVQQTQQPRAFGDGIVFVDLAPVTSPDFVVVAVAAALGMHLTPRRGDVRSPAQLLLDFLRPRQLLLVLDNLEHLLSAGIASLILDLLRGAPTVKLLTTSRQRLNLREEQLYTLAGLRYPTAPAPQNSRRAEVYASEQLLLAAARRLRPDFVLLPDEEEGLGQICRLVEGMPLALELAAAWVDALSLSGIAAELSGNLDLLAADRVDLPERHRSIRTTFDGTWRRLEPDEQEAFMHLSVFRGGLTRAAAEQVAGAPLPMLARLIGKCLLQFQPADERYRVHEVLRQFGQEKLAGSGALDTVRKRHFAHYHTLAETATAHLFGAEQIAWLDRLEAEHDNLRAALTWGLVQPGMAEAVAQLVIALAWFWRIRSHVLEGLIWLEQALSLPDLATATRAGLLNHAGHLAWMQDDFALARTREEESLRLWQSLGPPGRQGAAYASHSLGMALYSAAFQAQPDLTPAMRSFQTSLSLFEEVADEWGIAFTLSWLARCHMGQHEHSLALAATEASLAGFRRLGNPWGLGLTLSSLADLKLQAGDLTAARQLAEEAQTLRRQVGHRHSLGVGLDLLARIALQEGKPSEAAAYYHEAIVVFESLGNMPYADELRATLATVQADGGAHNASP